MWNHRVEEPQSEGAALGVRARGGDVGVVEAKLGAPGLETGLTGLLHVREAWCSEQSHIFIDGWTVDGSHQINVCCLPVRPSCLD